MRLEIWNEYSNHKIAESWVADEARANHIRAASEDLVSQAIKAGHDINDCVVHNVFGAVTYRLPALEFYND